MNDLFEIYYRLQKLLIMLGVSVWIFLVAGSILVTFFSACCVIGGAIAIVVFEAPWGDVLVYKTFPYLVGFGIMAFAGIGILMMFNPSPDLTKRGRYDQEDN